MEEKGDHLVFFQKRRSIFEGSGVLQYYIYGWVSSVEKLADSNAEFGMRISEFKN